MESETQTRYSIIEDELDQIMMRILILMDQYIKCQKNIENHLRSGCLDLAKARYIVGNRNISALQLPGDDATGVTANFKVAESEMDEVTQFTSTDATESLENINDGMENMTVNEDETKPKPMKYSKDPLKWFGFLVPQNLRHSKTTFEKCLEIVVECANIQLQLQHNLKEFECRKKTLENYS